MSLEYQAQLDWATLGEFIPDQFSGEDHQRYEKDEKPKKLKNYLNNIPTEWYLVSENPEGGQIV